MSQTLRRRWTEEDVRRLRLLADGNVTAIYIAKSLVRSVASVKLKAHWLNMSLARRKASDRELSAARAKKNERVPVSSTRTARRDAS
jgi:hypothetical protein